MADIKQIIFNILKVGADAPSISPFHIVFSDRRGRLSLLCGD